MGDRRFYPPERTVDVKAIACQLPVQQRIPLSRFSPEEILLEVRSESGLRISRSTVWRILNQDAIRLWYHRP